MVRLICGDDGPISPGYKTMPIEAKVNGSLSGPHSRQIDAGSYTAGHQAGRPLTLRPASRIAAIVQAHWVDKAAAQTVLACHDLAQTGSTRGVTLGLDRSAAPGPSRWATAAARSRSAPADPLLAKRWYLDRRELGRQRPAA